MQSLANKEILVDAGKKTLQLQLQNAKSLKNGLNYIKPYFYKAQKPPNLGCRW